MLDWAALPAFSVACAYCDFLIEDARRYDNSAIAVVEDDVGAVGIGESWRAFEEFFGVHSVWGVLIMFAGDQGNCVAAPLEQLAPTVIAPILLHLRDHRWAFEWLATRAHYTPQTASRRAHLR